MNDIHGFIVDSHSGEVRDEIRDGDRLTITRRESLEFMRSKQATPIKHFAKQNIDEFQFLLEELTGSEVKFLIGCINSLGYEDNCVKNRQGRPLGVEEIAARIGMSRKTAYSAANSLISLDILCKAKNSREFQLFVCPLVAGRGNRYNAVLQTMFRNYRVRSQGNVKWGRLQ